jgi:DNA polymerase III alpha subunit
LRKAIAKSKGKEALAKFHEAFIKGAIARGMPRDAAERLWDQIVQHGAYSFNKSHAVAYAMVT